ncbi:hypothetical protein NDU88_006120 [Pleurodeles waltl]|uniref:Uncharacterized protein n=1 Tax=Pleurodeles waltl TaxID=8319 RepID=A0AAV7TCZ4_PLEWA|nr:hypothetical protein NDU88_006120 [Pleurodeles waltl]
MDACECSGGARAGSLRPERHNRKPRAPGGAAGKRSSQRSRGPVRRRKGRHEGEKEPGTEWVGGGNNTKGRTEEGGGKERGGRG